MSFAEPKENPADRLAEVRDIVDKVTLSIVLFVDHEFLVKYHPDSEVMYLQARYLRADSTTGKLEVGSGRKWHISQWATESEIVMTALKAAITNAEHEIRESFTYNGKHLFNPHTDVKELLKIDKRDARDGR